MKKLLLAAGLLAATTLSVHADVIIDNHLSGTGDNVVFDSFIPGLGLAVGSFNGQHQGFVDFTDLSGNPAFTGAANGNDIKITNTSDLQVQVFATDKTTVLPTATDVFSIIGTGNPFLFVTANESGGGTNVFTFDLVSLFGALGPGQNGFTLTAINGETINKFVLLDQTGTITDFEHYRVDVATPVEEVIEPASVALFGMGLAGLGVILRRRKAV